MKQYALSLSTISLSYELLSSLAFSLSLSRNSLSLFPPSFRMLSNACFLQVNGAPPSECVGGEEDAGASYVELGQGGQEVVMVMMMMILTR